MMSYATRVIELRALAEEYGFEILGLRLGSAHAEALKRELNGLTPATIAPVDLQRGFTGSFCGTPLYVGDSVAELAPKVRQAQEALQNAVDALLFAASLKKV